MGIIWILLPGRCGASTDHYGIAARNNPCPVSAGGHVEIAEIIDSAMLICASADNHPHIGFPVTGISRKATVVDGSAVCANEPRGCVGEANPETAKQ
jgi:hypothetical protein